MNSNLPSLYAPVFRIFGISDDVVHGFSRHERVWHARLAVQHCAQVPQFSHHLTLKDLLFSGPYFTLKRAYPSHVSHGSLHVLDMKLIF